MANPNDRNQVDGTDESSRSRPRSARKTATTVYITEEQQAMLKELNKRTRVPIAEYIREGIDLVLQKNQSDLPGQLSFNEV